MTVIEYRKSTIFIKIDARYRTKEYRAPDIQLYVEKVTTFSTLQNMLNKVLHIYTIYTQFLLFIFSCLIHRTEIKNGWKQSISIRRVASQFFFLASPDSHDKGIDSISPPLPLCRLCRCLRRGGVLNEKWRKQVQQNDFEGPFCLSCTFIFQSERNWMKKSARVLEKLVSPGLPGLQVATRLSM